MSRDIQNILANNLVIARHNNMRAAEVGGPYHFSSNNALLLVQIVIKYASFWL